MKTLQEVSSDHILSWVLEAVRSARRLIRTTMDLEEEERKPLPEAYFFLLQQKLQEGVQLDRVGFGSSEATRLFLQKHPFSHPRYHFSTHQKGLYRRMILIDDTRLFFAKEEQNNRRFFITDDPEIISDYLSYFMRVRSSDDQSV